MSIKITNFGNISSIWNFPQTLPTWVFDLVLEPGSTNSGVSTAYVQKGIDTRSLVIGQFDSVYAGQKISEFCAINQNALIKSYVVYKAGLLDEQWEFDGASVKVGDFFSDHTNEELAQEFIGNDSFVGSATRGDYVNGYAGNDRMSNFGAISNGLDVFFGGEGVDTAIFNGNKASYSIQKSNEIWDPAREVSDLTGYTVADATKNACAPAQLYQVERLEFSDLMVALDIDEVANKAYRIYKAAFDRTPDAAGLGYWIAQMDKGMDIVEVAARFVDSAEFRQLYGSSISNATFITNVYNNVLDRKPDAAGLAWWDNEMKTNPAKTWQKVLADFSESTENKGNVAVLVANGITYDPWE